MTDHSAAATLTHRLVAVVLLGIACDPASETITPEPLLQCDVDWQGPLTTEASRFDVRVCWKRDCTANIPLQLAPNDAGLASPVVEFRDAGCVPMTAGGPPSRCDLPPPPPPPGCGFGAIGNTFSVRACVEREDAGVRFGARLSSSSPSLPGGGDRFGLTVTTAAGEPLVDATGTVPQSPLSSSSTSGCQSASFDLTGARIAE